MRQTLEATWKLLECAYEIAKKEDRNIIFSKEVYNNFKLYFENWHKIILDRFMNKNIVHELDRHKIAAILVISIIQSKAISYKETLDDEIFIGSELLALSTGLSYMQDQLNILLTEIGEKNIEKYIMPTPLSCETSYFEVIARNLYYENYATDKEENKIWSLNPLQLANTFYLIEYLTLKENDIDPVKLKEER